MSRRWIFGLQERTGARLLPLPRIRELTRVDRHDVALVLGSGWAGALDLIGETLAEVPDRGGTWLSRPGSRGTSGSSDRFGSVIATVGRCSSEPGPTSTKAIRQVVHGVRTAAAAGCRAIVLTNGCGGLREEWGPGTPVLISDHINLTATSPLEGATFVDLTDLYASRLRAIARQVDPSLPRCVRTVSRAALRDAGRGADGETARWRSGRHVDQS